MDRLLCIPVGVLVATAILLYWLYRRWTWLQNWLDRRNANRVIFGVIGNISAVAATVIIRFPEFSKIVNGEELGASVILPLCLVAVFATIPVWVTATMLRQTDATAKRLKDAEARAEKAKIEEDRARNSEFFQIWVSRCFLGAIGNKRARINDELEKHGCRLDDPHATLTRYRQVANPRVQVFALIAVVYEIYRTLLSNVSPMASLRVAYYRASKGKLELEYCWDGSSTTCIKTRVGKSARFKLDSASHNSLAVSVAHTGVLEIVEKANESHQNEAHPFWFFSADQRKRIGSMVAMPLGDRNEKGVYSHIVCIDTNAEGFFSPAQFDELELVKSNLEQRLLCEIGMDELLGGDVSAKKSNK